MSHPPHRQDLNWLVNEFTTKVEDVAHAIVVSADGVPLALSAGIPKQAVEQLAAITSGLTSLIIGAARVFEAGFPTQALVEMDRGLMFVKSISDGSSLAVLTAPECDTRQVSYEMTLLVEAVGEVLTPAVRAEILSRAGRSGLPLRRVVAGQGKGIGGMSRPPTFGIKNDRDDCHGERRPTAALEPLATTAAWRHPAKLPGKNMHRSGQRPVARRPWRCGWLHGGDPSREVKSRRGIHRLCDGSRNARPGTRW